MWVHASLLGIVFAFFAIPPKKSKKSNVALGHRAKNWLFFLFVLLVVASLPELLKRNVFINQGQIANEIEYIEINKSKGRNLGALLYSVFQLIPIILLDVWKGKRFKILIVLLYLFLMSGSSRGAVLIVFLTLLLDARKAKVWTLVDLFRLMMGSVGLGAIFIILSQVRDSSHFNILTLVPISMSFLMPGYNASLLMAEGIQRNFLLLYQDLVLKFVPSAIYPAKSIFSFNIEMTYQIYDYMRNSGLSAISVFTFISEFFVYKPTWLSFIFPLIVMRFFYGKVFAICSRFKLSRTAIYVALYSFIVLKSRVLDLISFLVFTTISLLLLLILNRFSLKNKNG